MRTNLKIGRNSPCPCGSGKKYKQCCLKTETSVDPYDRLRSLEGALIPKLLRFAKEEYGQDDFFETAWKEWRPGASSSFDDDEHGYETQVYLPWYLFTSMRPPLAGDGHQVPSRAFVASRKGTYLSSEERKFIELTEAAPFTFYTVEEVKPNYSFTLRDVLRQEFVEVRERSGTRFTELGNILFGRHVTFDGTTFMMGMSPQQFEATDLVKVVALRKKIQERLGVRPLTEEVLVRSADAVAALYREMRDQTINPQAPNIQNTDGNTYLPQKLHFKTDVSIEQAFSRLEELAVGTDKKALREDFECDSNGKVVKAYLPWLRRGNAKFKTWDNTILGNIDITEGKIIVEVNSENRAEKIRTEIERKLGRLVTYQTKLLEPIDHLLQGRSYSRALAMDTQFIRADFSGQEGKRLQERSVNRHWREWAVSPLDCLGGKSPQEAAKDDEGRELLEALFRSMKGNNQTTSVLHTSTSHLKKMIGWDTEINDSTPSTRDALCGRAVSDVFLEYIDPLLTELGDELANVSPRAMKKFVRLPWMVWNSVVLAEEGADDIETSSLSIEGFKGLPAGAGEEEGALLKFLVDRKISGFSQYKYLLGDVKFNRSRDGGLICRAEARLPQ